MTDLWSPLAEAVDRYLAGDDDAHAEVIYEDGARDRLDAIDLVRDHGLPPAEAMALDLAAGHVLDAGAGAGPHVLALQDRGLDVTALDVSPALVDLMRRRGVHDARLGDLLALDAGALGRRFDTVLLLMNGLGLAGDLAGLDRLFEALDGLVAPGGAALVESSDLDRSDDPAEHTRMAAREAAGRFRGETRYRLAAPGGPPGPPYGWLFLAAVDLVRRARRRGWRCQIIHEDGEGGYLARLIQARLIQVG